jgi:molybdenum cofactor biosynthesis enzyme MoaA
MTPEQIKAYPMDPRPEPGDDLLAITRRRLQAANQWSSRQQLGNRMAIGCVALEITQRCNLDCTCCYLSENSEAVRDLPLSEVFRRIDVIHSYFGPGTAVQVTGGDPTLRKKSELVQIVSRVRERGMRPTLFTNGIKTNREYLRELAQAGLADVAFHVDLTQERKGYASEVELNAVRQQYVDSCRDNGLAVFFNFTVTEQSFDEIPEIVRFYIRNADVVKTASFQLQADTGRGTQRERAGRISQASVIAQIEKGAATSIDFDASPVGHSSCNRYAMCFAVNGKLYNALDESAFVARITAAGDASWDRYTRDSPLRAALRWVKDHPGDLWPALRYIASKVRLAWRDLFAARGRIHRLSFFLHNFMDACHLEEDRIKACSFYTVTRDGPVSMCLANAKRDEYILQRVPVQAESGAAAYWDPLSGEVVSEESGEPVADPTLHPLKRLKGRSRQIVSERRQRERLLQIEPATRADSRA